MIRPPPLGDILGRRTLIYGDVGVGKSQLLAEIIGQLMEKGYGEEITVVDMAPKKIGKAGGEITMYLDVVGLRYLRPSHIYAPRLQACNPDDLGRYVKANVESLDKLLEKYKIAPTRVLAVNDVSIYLQGRTAAQLIEVLKLSETFIGSCYYGHSLDEDYGTGVSAWERRQVEELIRWVDNPIYVS